MMPNVQTTIFGFEQTVQLRIVAKTVTGMDLVESNAIKVTPLLFEGSLQPIHPRELKVKPEGERKWKWWNLYTDFPLVDTVLKDDAGTLYRVMASNDWSRAGYFQYQVVEGPGV